jgi:hypothetical protein
VETTPIGIPVLQAEEKVIGSAYLTQDGEIVFEYCPDSLEVALVEPPEGSSGPWAVRLRPAQRAQRRGAIAGH